MTKVSRRCPACHGEVMLDDEKEFGFCEQCGAKIMLDDPAAMISDTADPEAPAFSGSAAPDMSDTGASDSTEASAGAVESAEAATACSAETNSAGSGESTCEADTGTAETAVSIDTPAVKDSFDAPAFSSAPTTSVSAETSALLVSANRSFEDRNFAQAHDQYTKVLAAFPDSYEAIYRDAICSVYLAAPDTLDADTFADAMASAARAQEECPITGGKSYVDISAAKDLDITNMLISMFSAGQASDTTQSCLDNCRKAYDGWLKIAAFAHAAAAYIEKESLKESALSSAVDFCDLIKNKQMSYLAGMETDKDGVSKPVYKTYTPDASISSRFSKLRAELADTFNNLPSRVAKINDLKINIQNISGTVSELREQSRGKTSELTSASKSFWKDHPQQRKERFYMQAKSLLILAVAAIIGVFVYIIKQPLYAALALLAGLIVTVVKICRDTRKYDDKVLSLEVKLLQSDLDFINSKLSVEESALKEKQKALAEFEKTNL